LFGVNGADRLAQRMEYRPSGQRGQSGKGGNCGVIGGCAPMAA